MDKEAKEAAAKALTALERERERMNAGIAALRSLLDLPAENASQLVLQVESVRSPAPSKSSHDDGPYRRMSVAQAIVTYLRAVGRPQNTPQIAAALLKGGIRSGSEKFTNTVYSRCYVLMQKGIVQRVEAGVWALTEWSQKIA